MFRRISMFMLIIGCMATLMIGFGSCSGGSRGRSTAHVKKHSGFSPGKGKAKAPGQRIKSARR
ncbi:hypothetical protein [Rhodoflexus caldus]|uniref:hypothetical protein n=1 Tax=Rhodoflexus caldus TaxID=2891236 RepID=UPI00202A4123|nr:hypothetical protein [Rhodoflexus caldus]